MKALHVALVAALLIPCLAGCSATQSPKASPQPVGKPSAAATSPSASPSTASTPATADYGPVCKNWADANAANGTVQSELPAVYEPLSKAVRPACVIRTGTVFEALFPHTRTEVSAQLIAAGWHDATGYAAGLDIGQCQLSVILMTDGPDFGATWGSIFGSKDSSKFSRYIVGTPRGC